MRGSWLRELGKRLLPLRTDSDIRDELQSSLRHPDRGWRGGRPDLGGGKASGSSPVRIPQAVMEKVREVEMSTALESWYCDFTLGLRSLRRNPVFAITAILTLAVGIGANTAIFSLINSVLLSALPVRDPHSLVILTNPASNGVTIGGKSGEREELTYSEFRQLRDLSSVFASLMACQIEPERVPVRVDGAEPEELVVQLVSSEYFSTLGVPALLGRTLSPDDDPAAPNAVISYDYWQRRFGRRADVLGSRITIRQGVFSIIGVAPASFFGETVGQRPEIWVPLPCSLRCCRAATGCTRTLAIGIR